MSWRGSAPGRRREFCISRCHVNPKRQAPEEIKAGRWQCEPAAGAPPISPFPCTAAPRPRPPARCSATEIAGYPFIAALRRMVVWAERHHRRAMRWRNSQNTWCGREQGEASYDHALELQVKRPRHCVLAFLLACQVRGRDTRMRARTARALKYINK